MNRRLWGWLCIGWGTGSTADPPYIVSVLIIASGILLVWWHYHAERMGNRDCNS
jgi:hypothetical protein